MIEVSEHNPAWQEWFVTLKHCLEEVLQGVAYQSIEHVGSTSIAGLCAKPILDIDIIVTTAQLGGVLERLAIGHHYRGELGIPGRHAIALTAAPHKTNCYVILEDCLALKNHLAIKRVLTEDTTLRERYAARKRELASTAEDLDGYCIGKTDLLVCILREGGLTDEEVEEIASSNR